MSHLPLSCRTNGTDHRRIKFTLHETGAACAMRTRPNVNSIIYIVGLVVIILAILSFIGIR